jgi:hypothetical protein
LAVAQQYLANFRKAEIVDRHPEMNDNRHIGGGGRGSWQGRQQKDRGQNETYRRFHDYRFLNNIFLKR